MTALYSQELTKDGWVGQSFNNNRIMGREDHLWGIADVLKQNKTYV